MESTTASKALTASRLDLLLSVLAAIERASKMLEGDVDKNDRALRDFWMSLRFAAYGMSYKFRELRAAGLDAKLVEHTVVLLNAIEEFYEKIYSRSHALCRLVDTKSTDQLCSAFSFPESVTRDKLLHIFDETFQELDRRFSDFDELSIQPVPKRRRDPPWGIHDSASKVFRAISQCPDVSGDCGVMKHSETRLALATYSNISDSEEHFDILFAPQAKIPLCMEVRIHMRPLPSTSTRSSGPKVTFACENGKPASAVQKWRAKTPRRVSHFCELLDPSKKDVNNTRRLNVALDSRTDIWQHLHTQRFLEKADLSHFVSLADVLASDTRNLDEMTKQVLAVILGYSLFHLYEGPWLGCRNATGLSREKIVFFKKDGRILLRPFLRSDLCSNAVNPSNEHDKSHDDDDPLYPYPSILSFGVILLELHLGESLESFQPSEPLTSANDKWIRACQVFDQRKPYIHGRYRDAIEACLNSQFGVACEDEDERSGGSEVNEENIKQLRGLIFSNIVGPLQDELEYGWDTYIKFDDLDKQAASMDFSSELSGTEAILDSRVISQNQRTLNTSAMHQQTFSHPNKSSPRIQQAANTGLATSKRPGSPLFSPKFLKRIDTGELYNVFGNLDEPVLMSSPRYNRTDEWIKRFKDLKAFKPLQQLPAGDLRRVKVAIIDTGIDMGHVDIQAAKEDGRIAKVCDWVDGRKGKEDWAAGDSSGHGTHIASIMLNMAPNVDLYIARITKGPELSDIEAGYVADAIETARLKWGCDIINLSLGFTRPIPSIQAELESALNADVLVFAAASNDGANSGLAYPAWEPRVLCIYSTDSYGNRSCFSPSPNKQHGCTDGFSIVGEDVRGAWPTNLSKEGANHLTRTLSGTSFATPVAAALAACVLGFAAGQASKSGQSETKSSYKVASFSGMRRVLLKMAVTRDPGYQYLDASILFDRTESEIAAEIWKALNPTKR